MEGQDLYTGHRLIRISDRANQPVAALHRWPEPDQQPYGKQHGGCAHTTDGGPARYKSALPGPGRRLAYVSLLDAARNAGAVHYPVGFLAARDGELPGPP